MTPRDRLGRPLQCGTPVRYTGNALLFGRLCRVRRILGPDAVELVDSRGRLLISATALLFVRPAL